VRPPGPLGPIFNIITMKRKSTAIAPTYIIKNIIPRNSSFNKSNKPVALQKTRIKKITECIGLPEIITMAAETKARLAKILKKSRVCMRVFFFESQPKAEQKMI
jgi:hypothetical protein